MEHYPQQHQRPQRPQRHCDPQPTHRRGNRSALGSALTTSNLWSHGPLRGHGFRVPALGLLAGLVMGIALGSLGTVPAVGATPGNRGDRLPFSLTIAQAESALDYTRAMEIGYAAAAERDYHTALINFRRALAARPGDRYALGAIANMELYIEQERAEAAKRRRFLTLQTRLAEAVELRDWPCAAASLDELVTFLPSGSLEQTRLITYRGEVTGFINDQDGVDSWSSVCSGQFPNPFGL